jgi:hypothetical protein
MLEGSGSIPLTNGSGSRRFKNTWIRIRNTENMVPVPQHWFLPPGSECAARRPRPESSSAPPGAHSTLVPNPAAAHLVGAALQNMDQITTNPKCRLYWCLIEFIDGRTVSHVGIFDPSYELAPLYPSQWFIYPPPPSLPVKSTGVHVFIQCVGGGSGARLVRRINTCRQIPLLVTF